VAIVAGKGGVGKTTVTAVLARAAIRRGLRVLVVELDGKPRWASCCPTRCNICPPPRRWPSTSTRTGSHRVTKRLASRGIIDVVATASPGIDDIVVLGKIKQLERSDAYDLIVVDGPAAGHAITFLLAAQSLLASVRGGPIHTQATEVLEMLADPTRCQVVLVTLPETTPVNEAVETAYALEDRVGVHLGPVVVNGVDMGPALDADAAPEGSPMRPRRRVPQRPPGAAPPRVRPARRRAGAAAAAPALGGRLAALGRRRRRSPWPDADHWAPA
jgi:arsenite-transporting ATPase